MRMGDDMSKTASFQELRQRAILLLERYADYTIQGDEGASAVGPSDSTAMIVDLLDKCLALEADAIYVRLLDHFGMQLQRQYHLEQVEAFFAAVQMQEDLSVTQRVSFTDLQVRILIQLGERKMAQSALAQAWSAANTPSLQARVLNRQGYLHAIYSQYEEAEEVYRSGITVAEDGGDVNILAILHSNYGDMLFQKGEYDRAVEQYEKALEIAKPISLSFACALAEGGLGMTLDHLGQYEAAALHHEASRTYYTKVGDEYGIIRINLNLSYNALCRGDNEKVKELAGLALTQARALGDLHRIAFAHQRLGEAFLRTNDHDIACDHFVLALEQRVQLGKPVFIEQTVESLHELMETAKGATSIPVEQRTMLLKRCEKVLEITLNHAELSPA